MRNASPAYPLHRDDADGLIASKATRRRARPGDARQARLRGVLIAFALLLGLCAASLLVAVAARGLYGSKLTDTRPATATITIASSRGDACTRMIFDNASGRMVKVDTTCTAADLESQGSPFRGTVDRLDRIQRSFQTR